VPLGSLALVGRHNVDNAMAALLLALCLGVIPGAEGARLPGRPARHARALGSAAAPHAAGYAAGCLSSLSRGKWRRRILSLSIPTALRAGSQLSSLFLELFHKSPPQAPRAVLTHSTQFLLNAH